MYGSLGTERRELAWKHEKFVSDGEREMRPPLVVLLRIPSQSEATQTSSIEVMLVSRKNSVVGVSDP